jgi:hypothetical protein
MQILEKESKNWLFLTCVVRHDALRRILPAGDSTWRGLEGALVMEALRQRC